MLAGVLFRRPAGDARPDGRGFRAKAIYFDVRILQFGVSGFRLKGLNHGLIAVYGRMSNADDHNSDVSQQ